LNTAGSDSDAEALLGAAAPLVQDNETDTEAALFGMKSLCTVKIAWLRALVIVQVPTERLAEQVTDDV
jgi:hypothetical protein